MSVYEKRSFRVYRVGYTTHKTDRLLLRCKRNPTEKDNGIEVVFRKDGGLIGDTKDLFPGYIVCYNPALYTNFYYMPEKDMAIGCPCCKQPLFTERMAIPLDSSYRLGGKDGVKQIMLFLGFEEIR